MLPRVSVERAWVDATEGNPMDPEQPDALYLLEGGEEATEGGDRKRNGRGKKRNWNTLSTICLFNRCLLFGVYSNKVPLPQAGGQAHSGTVRDRAFGYHPSLTSLALMSKDHTTGR